VKIRGTPAHIAEKYLSLARDAQSSGDPVLAENYLQHAEHYSRIIMAYRDQLQQPGDANGNGQRLLHGEVDEFGDDDGDDMLDDGFQPLLHPQHPQPPQPRPPYEPNRHESPRLEGGHRHDRPFRRDHGRFRDRAADRSMDRSMDRSGDRSGDRSQDRSMEGRPQPERAGEPMGDAGGERRREKFQGSQHEQPDFLRRPVRRARAEGEAPVAAPAKEEPSRD
jgi:hypothetical protein